MKHLLTLSIFIVLSLHIQAQKSNAIGLRGGFSSGVTFQHYLNESHAIELIAHSRWRGTVLTGLYEVHKPFFDVSGVKWYYGIGAHVGFYRYYKGGPKWHKDEWRGTRSVIGADAILGLEYFFDEIPFNISVDWKPVINVIGYSGLWADEAALSIRYVF